MKKKGIIFVLLINYLAFFFSVISELIYEYSIPVFVNRFFTIILSINSILFIFYKFIYVNFNSERYESNFDVSIPPVESELKMIFDEVNEVDKKNNDDEDLFKELKFKDFSD